MIKADYLQRAAGVVDPIQWHSRVFADSNK